MDKIDRDDDMMLEACFAAARARDVQPSATLLARVSADAGMVQAAFLEPAGAVRPGRDETTGAPGALAAVLGVLGGWRALGGMIAATLAGVWIGMNGALPVQTATSALFDTTETVASVDLMPGYEVLASLSGLEGS